jgi:hypothetical protein
MKTLSLRLIPASLVLVFAPFIIGCGAEPATGDSESSAAVTVRSDLSSMAYSSGSDGFTSRSASGRTVDSLEVTRAMVVVSDLKLHGVGGDGGEQIGPLQTGQFLMVFDQGYYHHISYVSVLAGTYPRVKFEVHRLEGDLDSLRAIDDMYREFVTYGPTSTVIIQGYTYRGDVKLPFVFSTALVLNGQFFFDTPLSLEDGMQQELRVRFVSQTAFEVDGAVLDPLDANNRAAIENNLRGSVQVFRL